MTKRNAPKTPDLSAFMWHVEHSEATGRYYVARGYYLPAREIWANALGACDFRMEEDAQAKADQLNGAKQ